MQLLQVFVCDPVRLCVLTKLCVLLHAAPYAVVRAPLTLVHTVLRGHDSCVAWWNRHALHGWLGIREMKRDVKPERTHVQINNMICLSVYQSILRRDDP